MADDLLLRIDQKLNRLLEQNTILESPWIGGDSAAAKFAGYKSREGFLRWAREAGIKPSREGRKNFWSRQDIIEARKRNMA